MKPLRRVLFALFAFAAALVFLSALPASGTPAQPAIKDAAQAPSAQEGQALFPGLVPACVTSVCISTPQTAFDLRRESHGRVSVNGQQADSGVFLTLLEQLDAMAYTPASAFSPSGAPLLTLRVYTQGKEHAAAFYADEGTGEFARVIYMPDTEPAFGRIEGWRIGTLMLACEGTRIQDEHGRETPMQQSE